MSKQCVHLDEMKVVQPSANGCEDCLKIGAVGYTCAYALSVVTLAAVIFKK